MQREWQLRLLKVYHKMLGDKYILKIQTYCPYCNSINNALETYELGGFRKYIFPNDIVRDFNHNSNISIIKAYGYCEKCGKSYLAKVGIKNSRLTSMVISEK